MLPKLRIWWIPQVPGRAYRKEVTDIDSAKLLLTALSEYDIFQLDNNIKPDFCNAGGLEVFEDGDWCEWHDEETDQEIWDIIDKDEV